NVETSPFGSFMLVSAWIVYARPKKDPRNHTKSHQISKSRISADGATTVNIHRLRRLRSAAKPQPKKSPLESGFAACCADAAMPFRQFFQVRLCRLSPSVLVWRPSFLGGGRSPKIVGVCLRKGRATSSQQAAKPNLHGTPTECEFPRGPRSYKH